MRVLYILTSYPQLSQTYIKSELNALNSKVEVKIISLSKPDVFDHEHKEFQLISQIEEIIAMVQSFKPDVIHSHYLVNTKLVYTISKRTKIPFTIRAHSFDVLSKQEKIVDIHQYINDDLCKGILAFPFTRKLLEKINMKSNKIIEAPPVVDVQHFYSTSANGNEIMNVGAYLPKKQMEDFLKLSTLIPERKFNLYAIGSSVKNLALIGLSMRAKVNFISPIAFSAMPAEYKKHEWLVYTANKEFKSVGWPMAAIEAMASGTMVCLPNIRPDIKDYVGEYAYLYNDVEDLVDIIRKPVDKQMRKGMFDYAQKFDCRKSIHLLTDLW